MKRKLSTQLALGFAMIVLVTVSLISLAANILINRQFERYVENQQKEFSDRLAAGLISQYDPEEGKWNRDYIHGMGMYALGDGYILKVSDANGQVIWDAENHDMTLCHQIMNEISLRMKEEKPEVEGDFVTFRYPLARNGDLIGYANISYYTPYYFNENGFRFIDSLNRILFFIGFLSVAGAVIAGILLARRIAGPIAGAIRITREISEGNYGIRLDADVNTRELHELTQAVDHMAESLEEQEMLRRRLTTDVAHELRTPLANVSSYLEAILEGIWEPTAERLKSCYDEIGRISGIISDLEKLREMENENLRLELEPVDLLSLARETAAGFEPEIEKRGLTCMVEGKSTMVSGDSKRLKQVIFNLLSNAVKYSADGGVIRILVEDMGTWGRLTVEDHGIGISKEDLPLIFERFYRTDRSRNRKTGGAGIGLTIAKAIIQAHGGQISVSSEEGKGSRFVVALPKCVKEV